MSTSTTAMTLVDYDDYATALANAGLSPDWAVLGDYQIERDIVSAHGGKKHIYKFTSFPIKNDSMVVLNPKHIVDQGMPNIPGIRSSMQATLMDIQLGQWFNGSTSHAAQAYSTAVFLLMQAVESMAEAK